MSKPKHRSDKNDGEQLRNQLKDIVAETQAETNELIAEKYKTLKSLKNRMFEMKRNFNRRVLNLQEDKELKCSLLSEKIEKFCKNNERIHPDLGQNIEIQNFTEKIVNFDGKAFQVLNIMTT